MYFFIFESSPFALRNRGERIRNGIYRYRVIEAETGLDKENVPPRRPHAEKLGVS